MLTRKQFEDEMYTRCLDELYQASQPSITYSELIELSKQNPERKLYLEHYLSSEECKFIIDKYINLYCLEDDFKRDCDIIIDDMQKGCIKDKYVSGTDEKPGYRNYEKVPPLSEEIGEENLQKVVEFIKMRKDFYRFNRVAENFKFNMFNYSPTSIKESVIDFYKTQGQDITIVDRNMGYNYERYYEGYSEEEIQEMINEENE